MTAPVVISGMGAVSALGIGLEEHWARLAEGEDGIGQIERFRSDDFDVHLGAFVPDRDQFAGLTDLQRCIAFAAVASREALGQAGTDPTGARFGLVLGTSHGDGRGRYDVVTEGLASELGVTGPRITISTACTSSTNAIGLARDLLRLRVLDAVLVGGADVLHDRLFAGFHALGVLNPGKCSPFGRALGTSLGEGAGMLVLERADAARSRGARSVATVAGYGLSSDAYHETSPDPTGRGVARALRSALLQAGLEESEIGYVNAHGTGTAANDRAEWQAIRSVFEERSDSLPVSGTKCFIGHAQGAAGVLELITSLIAQEHDTILPSLRAEEPRPFAPTDRVAGTLPRTYHYSTGAYLSAAFGGANASVLIVKGVAEGGEPQRRSVAVRGGAAVSEGGAETLPALLGGTRADLQPVQSYARGLNPRGMDEVAWRVIAGVAESLADARHTLGRDELDRTGLVLGATRVAPSQAILFEDSIAQRGLKHCSVSAFARIVLNAAAGLGSKAHSLRGPTSALTVGPESGVLAIAYAAELIASRTDVDAMFGGAADVCVPDIGDSESRLDGVGMLMLAPAGEGDETGNVHLMGWGIAGPGDPGAAVSEAFRVAGVEPRHLDFRCGRESADSFAGLQADLGSSLGYSEATSSALSAVAAFEFARTHPGSLSLAVSAEGASVSCALLFSSQVNP